MPTVSRVWIEEGCIPCYACAATAPAVFAVTSDDTVILAEVREDGNTSRNDVERSRLNAVGLEYEAAIQDAAFGCPVEVIHFDST
ncbi:MAG: ferredoxin [Planctomycetes bacterium]|jgi:ferredoxin|nr:ferredoxin [Planctomycetota bacterium]